MALSKNKIKYIHSLELKKNRKTEKAFLAEGHKLVGDLLGHFHCRLRAATDKWFINNKELQQLIKKGNKEQNEYLLREIKQKLYTYPEYKNYMHNYNKLMYIVLNINNRFNKLIDNKNCNRG